MQKLTVLPDALSELGDALEDPSRVSGWYVGSAQGGWATPAAEEHMSAPEQSASQGSANDS